MLVRKTFTNGKWAVPFGLAKVILKIFSNNSWKITANFNWNHYYYKSIHSEIKIVFYSSPPAQMNKFPRLFNKTGFPFQ